MIRRAHLKLIAGHSVRHGIRGGAGLISLILTLLVGVVLAGIALLPVDGAQEEINHAAKMQHVPTRALSAVEVTEIEGKVVDWTVTGDDHEFLNREKPAEVSAVLVVLVLVVPLLGVMGGFNQTSGDIASKGLRFLLFRTERSNIFFGRFIGTYLFSAAVFGLLFFILGVYLCLKFSAHGTGDVLEWLLSGYLRIMLLELPYIALCAMISAAIDSPFGSLVIALCCAYVLPLVVLIGSRSNENIAYGRYLTPWGYKWMLLAPPGGEMLLGIAVMFAFTALFLFVGHRNFSRRDL